MMLKIFMGVCLVLITISGCNMKNQQQIEKQLLARLIIFPSGIETEMYIIEIKNTGEIVTKFGDYKYLSITTIEKERSKQLGIQFMDLKKIIEKLPAVLTDKDIGVYEDGWEFVLQIPEGQKEYKGNFMELDKYDNIVVQLIQELIRLSPIEIDMHGWA